MYPIISVFGKIISMYAVMSVIGLLTSGVYFCRQIRRYGLDDNDAIIWLLVTCIGILLGGHIMFAVTNLDKFYMYSEVGGFKDFINTSVQFFGGSVFYGGLIGGMIFASVWIRLKNLDFKAYADIMASAAPLFHSFARVGCFLGGCCFGIESHFGFTVHGNVLSPAVNDVCRFPVQLLEAALNLVLFAIFRHLLKKERFKGGLFPMYLLSYSVIRFCDEFLRGDIIRGHVGLLSTSQWISIYIAILGTVWIIISRKIKCSAALRK